MPTNIPSWLPTVIMVPLVAFALYRRYKRTFGRQKVARASMILRIVLFTALSAVIVTTLSTANGLWIALGGAVMGILLAAVGLARTRFETTPEGQFYTPHTWIGLAVSALFLGRLAARFVTSYQSGALSGKQPIDPNRSVLTGGIFLLTASYYVVYYAGILWNTRAAKATPPPSKEPDPSDS